MIVTFTDFGIEGPYLGQMRAAALVKAPKAQVVDLMSDVPAFDVRAGAYLLPAVMRPLPKETVCLGVVDPGVGSDRRPLALRADGRWYVGPDNGLFEFVGRRADDVRWYEITWRPETLSASFHGRDLFAPVAGMIEARDMHWGEEIEPPVGEWSDWPDDWPAVVYIDRYGNCMTGIRYERLSRDAEIRVGGDALPRARVFSEVSIGAPFCYENASGLLEVAVNKGNAAESLGLKLGGQVSVSKLCD